MRERLRSSASRSTIRAGVSTSDRGCPGKAGGRVAMAPHWKLCKATASAQNQKRPHTGGLPAVRAALFVRRFSLSGFLGRLRVEVRQLLILLGFLSGLQRDAVVPD